MSAIAIRVENLSKAYRIGLNEQRHETLLGAMASFIRSPWENYRNLRKLSRFDDVSAEAGNQKSANRSSDTSFQLSAFNSHPQPSAFIPQPSQPPLHPSAFIPQPSDVIWALKDVSFEVKHGEVLGIIGRNGAGKSTLLKILSRITEPTSGRAEVYGRVGSLLEVGTGFHPDLTGRENIYLNGTILGMKKREIDAKFDAIVEFSGVEKFIDTPVKRYSTGMRVRLAFSVAAQFEPEILIVDEVLAVGDASFQKKCLGKMHDVAKQGRTIMFVSHNLAAVRQLCSRACVLTNGSLSFAGCVDDCINHYMKDKEELDHSGVIGSGSFSKAKLGSLGEIVKIEIEDQLGSKTAVVGIGESFSVRIYTKIHKDISAVSIGLEVKSVTGTPILNLRSDAQQIDFGPYKEGDLAVFLIKLPGLALYPGNYKLAPWFAEKDGRRIHFIEEGLTLTLESKGKYLSERMLQEGRGLILMDCDWSDSVEREYG